MQPLKTLYVSTWILVSALAIVSQAPTAFAQDAQPSSENSRARGENEPKNMPPSLLSTAHYDARLVLPAYRLEAGVAHPEAPTASGANDPASDIEGCPSKYIRTKTNKQFWIPGVVVLGLSIIGNALITMPGVHGSTLKGSVNLMPIPLVGPWVALADTEGWMTAYAVGSGTLQLAATGALLYGVTDTTKYCRRPR